MGLSIILNAGIETIIREGRQDLVADLSARELSDQSISAAEKALRMLPSIIEQLNRAFQDEACLMSVRMLFPTLMTYLWQTNDLIPSREGQLVLGLLDDAYLAVCIAKEVEVDLDLPEGSLDQAGVALKTLLPKETVGAIEKLVEEIITNATASVEQKGI